MHDGIYKLPFWHLLLSSLRDCCYKYQKNNIDVVFVPNQMEFPLICNKINFSKYIYKVYTSFTYLSFRCWLFLTHFAEKQSALTTIKVLEIQSRPTHLHRRSSWDLGLGATLDLHVHIWERLLWQMGKYLNVTQFRTQYALGTTPEQRACPSAVIQDILIWFIYKFNLCTLFFQY